MSPRPINYNKQIFFNFIDSLSFVLCFFFLIFSIVINLLNIVLGRRRKFNSKEIIGAMYESNCAQQLKPHGPPSAETIIPRGNFHRKSNSLIYSDKKLNKYGSKKLIQSDKKTC